MPAERRKATSKKARKTARNQRTKIPAKVEQPSFAGPVPILRIYDEMKTREFYVDFLGFNVDWEFRFETGGAVYMQVTLGSCVFQLSEHFGDGTPGTKVKVRTENLDGYNRTLLAKRYRHARPGITEHSWGERSMAIADPFGNVITFFESTP